MCQALLHNRESWNIRESKHISYLCSHTRTKAFPRKEKPGHIGKPVQGSEIIWHLLLKVTCSCLFLMLDGASC